MFSYRLFLKQAWNITKKYRYLWFFGIFASLLSIGGEYQLITQSATTQPGGSFLSNGNIIWQIILSPDFYQGFVSLATENSAALLAVICIFLLSLGLAIIMLYLAILSQSAIVSQSAQILLNKKKKNNLNISDGLAEAKPHFWRVLGLNLFSYIIVVLSLFLISLPLVFLIITDTLAISIAYTLLFIVFAPIALSIALLIKYAIAARVLENTSFVSSIQKGLKIFKNNWLVSLEMALILFIINFAVGIVTLFFIALLFMPMLFIAIQFYAPILAAISLVLSIGTMLVVASWLNTFQISTWTGLYLHLQDKKGRSKLERLFAKKK